ncbi:hypothetical protein GCM10022232_64370 [Streptomyces plumbiresistens]|uniref:Uncharacterized protein n=2 Tax=Streptomyces plumbiresistens TaxID=511811 RepID=A0ABP7SL43_9ACTN
MLDNLVSFGFQLISTLPLDHVLFPAQRAALQRIGAHVLVLGAEPGQAQDVEGTYTRFLDRHGATTLLAHSTSTFSGSHPGRSRTTALVDDLLSQLSPTTASTV